MIREGSTNVDYNSHPAATVGRFQALAEQCSKQLPASFPEGCKLRIDRKV